MKISVCIEMIMPGRPVSEKIRAVAAEGFRHIEFWSWKDKDLNEVRTICGEEGLSVSNFSGQRASSLIFSGEADDYVNEVRESLDAAEWLGCPNLMLLSNALGPNGEVLESGDHLSDAEKRKNALSVLNRLGDIADQKGITLHLEPLNTKIDHPGNFLVSSEQACEMIGAVGHPRIRVLYDIYHMLVMGENVKARLEANAAETGYLHFAEVPGRTEPRAGGTDLEGILRAAEKNGYQGFVGLEFKPSGDWPSAAAVFREKLSAWIGPG